MPIVFISQIKEGKKNHLWWRHTCERTLALLFINVSGVRAKLALIYVLYISINIEMLDVDISRETESRCVIRRLTCPPLSTAFFFPLIIQLLLWRIEWDLISFGVTGSCIACSLAVGCGQVVNRAQLFFVSLENSSRFHQGKKKVTTTSDTSS